MRRRRNTSTSGLVAVVPEEIRAVARRLKTAGASRVLLVGGAVIDMLQGRKVKDWDIEVAGLSMARLATAVQPLGSVDEVGKSFGIVKLALPSGLDIDFNVPRRDSKTGVGHKDFDIQVDPNMSVREAARRRDFTINAMGLDLLTGELHDPFGGLADLEAGVLRATDFERFQDDPLRVLRAAQLVARKVDRVDPATMQLFRQMVDQHQHLPKERLLGEWQKLLLKGSKPSRGLDVLKESGWLRHYPELDVLDTVPQHPEWHPEGDVWVHTRQAADAAAMVRDHVPADQREAFVFGTMLHDVGKAITTVRPEDVAAGRAPADRLYTAYGHDLEGGPIARKFLQRIGASNKVTDTATTLVETHMRPYGLVSGTASRAAYARLHRDLVRGGASLRLLSRVCQCDACASGRLKTFRSTGEPDWEHQTSKALLEWADTFDQEPKAPLVQGRDLIAMGLKPGNQFAPLLEYAQNLQDEGLSKDEILAQLRVKVAAPKTNPRDARGRFIPEKYLAGLSPRDRHARVGELSRSRDAYGTGDFSELPTDRKARVQGLVKRSPYRTKAMQRGLDHSQASDLHSLARKAIAFYTGRKPTNSEVYQLETDLHRIQAKGYAAWKSGGHRPGASAASWAHARIASFLVGGKTSHTADRKEFQRLPADMRAAIQRRANPIRVGSARFDTPREMYEVLGQAGVLDALRSLSLDDLEADLYATSPPPTPTKTAPRSTATSAPKAPRATRAPRDAAPGSLVTFQQARLLGGLLGGIRAYAPSAPEKSHMDVMRRLGWDGDRVNRMIRIAKEVAGSDAYRLLPGSEEHTRVMAALKREKLL